MTNDPESVHEATFALLGGRPAVSTAAVEALDAAERRLGVGLPATVRDWYARDGAVSILAEHSNADPPVPVEEFALGAYRRVPLLTIRHENQGVCSWAIRLDGSDDPPVVVRYRGARWRPVGPFSRYVEGCVWDYTEVFGRAGQVQAQNPGGLGARALAALSASHLVGPRTSGWPGTTQHRFAAAGRGILVLSSRDRADWYLAADDRASLETALRLAWSLDDVGPSFYAVDKVGKAAVAAVKADGPIAVGRTGPAPAVSPPGA